MDLYEEKEHIISSDEYSDEDEDDDDLMNDAVRARNQNFTQNNCGTQLKQPHHRIDQKQKELSSLIRRNKISVIYKKKAIKWLNSKIQRERYKERLYINTKSCGSKTCNSFDQNYDAMRVEDIEDAEKLQTGLISNCSKEEIKEEKVVHTINSVKGIGNHINKDANIQPEKDFVITDIKCDIQSEENMQDIEQLKQGIEKTKNIPRKRRSKSPLTLNQRTDSNEEHVEKKFRAESPQFYKKINDMFPKFDAVATNHINKITNNLLKDVEEKIKSLSNEIDSLNEILQAKEVEWNRLLHLKMVKEEIYSRLNRKRHALQLKESFPDKPDRSNLFELKELEFYLSDKKEVSGVNHSFITIQKLIENRANMNANDLKREKNNTSRLHSLLVSQNMLHATESLVNTCFTSNGTKTDVGLANKCKESSYLGGERIANNNGRQEEVRDVKNLIADFRQKNPELFPRVGNRIKSTELHAHQGCSVPSFENQSHSQLLIKDQHPEYLPLSNHADEISITPIGRPKQLPPSRDNVRLEDNFLKSQLAGDFNGKSPRIMQYPLCQECKTKESRFVCAGCGNQWYCSKNCQISAWDKHSDLCTE